MSWTHYTHPIYVGSIKSKTTTDSSLIFRNYIIGDTSGYTNYKKWTWGANQSIQDFCTANSLTLHYVESGDGNNTTNTNRAFETTGPEAVVLDPGTTESDLSGLVGLTNAVTHIHDKTDTDIYELNSSCRLVLAHGSTLNHDPEHEHLLIAHVRPSDGSNYYSTLLISHDARYNYGSTYTSNGRTTYSIGTGLLFTGTAMDNWNPRDTAFAIAGGNASNGVGKFVGRGGTVACSKPIAGGTYDIIRTTFNGTRTSGNIQEWRSFGSSYSYFDGRVSNYSIQYIDPNTDLVGLELNQGLISENLGEFQEFTLRDFDVSKNPYVVDIGPDSPSDRGHRDYLIINSETGSDIIAMWRDLRNANHQKGNAVTCKEVSFNIQDINAQPVEGCKMYLVDNPSAYAKDVTYTAGSSMLNTYHSRFSGTNGAGSGLSTSITIVSTGFDAVTIVAGGGKTLNTLISEYNADTNNSLDLTLTDGDGTQVPTKNITLAAKPYPTLLKETQFYDDGKISYNYADAIEYNKTTDVNGNVATFQIVTSTQLKPFNANIQSTEASDFYDNYNNGWRESDGASPAFSDWDTTRFGGYYKVDRRSDSNTNLDDFTFHFCSYNHLLTNTSQSLKGKGELTFDWIVVDDASITETDKTVVDGYTAIGNPSMFYDRAKSYLTDNFTGEGNTIVTRDGNTIDAGSYNVVLDNNVNDAFTFDGTTITIKADVYTGNISSTGTITLNNGAQVVGTYGDISVLPYTLTNIEAGSTIQLYNMETGGAGEIVNTTVGGTAGEKVTHTGTYANSLAEPGDEIRLRVTCQSGTAALLPYEVFGVAQSSGISFKVNQRADTVYNANGIDGSDTSITSEFTADYTNIQIDSSETDGVVTVQEIYAFYAYSVTTADGIDNFFGAITPIDGMNYRINTDVVDLKIQNTTDVDTILKGGRLYRDDNTSVIDTDSATGAGTGSFTHDTGFLLQYIAPQVENAIGNQVASATDMTTVKSDVQTIKNNTSVIPGLL